MLRCASHAPLIARSLGNVCCRCYNQWVEVRLLGPLEAREGDRAIALPRRQQRALLAALALRAGEVVSTDRLVADLWGERAPTSANGSLQNTVYALRKTLGRDVLVTQPPGYRLAIEPEGVDANRFERLLGDARDAEPARRVDLITEALALWRVRRWRPRRGGVRPARGCSARRVARRRSRGAARRRARARPPRGARRGVGSARRRPPAPRAAARPADACALSLRPSGRGARGLPCGAAALADELGLDPSPDLQELERRILRQDPALAPPGRGGARGHCPAAERRLVRCLPPSPPVDDDPETLRRRLDEVLATVRDVRALRRGARRFGPQGLVAVFGADAPRDDDALRAVRAAAELGLPAGIATGESVDGAGSVFTRAAELARGSGVQADERTRALVQHERDSMRLSSAAPRSCDGCESHSMRSPPRDVPCRHRPRRARNRQDQARSRVRRIRRRRGPHTRRPLRLLRQGLDVHAARRRAARPRCQRNSGFRPGRRVGLGATCRPRWSDRRRHPRRVVLGCTPSARGLAARGPSCCSWTTSTGLSLPCSISSTTSPNGSRTLHFCSSTWRAPSCRGRPASRSRSARSPTRKHGSSWQASPNSTRRR